MRKFSLLFVSFFSYCILFAQGISDIQFFEAVDLNLSGLEDVKSSFLVKDYSRAKKEYIKYLKSRRSPTWFIDWNANSAVKKRTTVDIEEADRYVKNEMLSCGIWHKFNSSINWKYNPTNNLYNEWTWQLNRHYAWITLGRAYWRTGNEKYAKAFVSQLNSWINQCKRPQDDGNYPGSPWRTLEAGIRMRYSWPYAFHYFLSSPSFDDESLFRMVKSIYEHALFFIDHCVSNQRLSHEMNGLYVIGALFPELKNASKWRSFAAEKLYQEEVMEFYPDGSQKQLSPSYHATNLSCIVSVYQIITKAIIS